MMVKLIIKLELLFVLTFLYTILTTTLFYRGLLKICSNFLTLTAVEQLVYKN